MSVSQPSLLKLIPKRVLESTGESILSGILIGIKARVGQQLIDDYPSWCGKPTGKAQPSRRFRDVCLCRVVGP